MDQQTLDIYDREAPKIAAYHRSHSPGREHDYALEFFKVGEPTIDIGCGSGRDTDWLHQQGFPTIGYDGSEGMLAEARQQYPDCRFKISLLPDLAGVEDGLFANALCNAVLMHIPRTDINKALHNIARVLQPGGRVVLSFRPSRESGDRETDGRLFTDYTLEEMQGYAEAANFTVLAAVTEAVPERNKTLWHIIVAEKSH